MPTDANGQEGRKKQEEAWSIKWDHYSYKLPAGAG